MANPTRARRQRFKKRHTLAAIILIVLPLFALGGALMPGMVEIEEKEPEPAADVDTDYEPIDFQRRPLLIPRDFSTGFVPELINFDPLHVDRARDPESMLVFDEIAELAFNGGLGELIILDDIEEFVRDVLFKDMTEPEVLEELPGGVFDDSIFALLPNPLGIDNPYQFDDFAGGSGFANAVPEPGTALLAALGLIALGRLGKRPSERDA